MSIFGGGGGGSSGPSTTTQYIREAPGIEERKLGLMDVAATLAKKPTNIPTMQVAGLGNLEQQGITASGVTGVGQPTVGSAVSGVQGAMTPIGAQQISQFLNPYQGFQTALGAAQQQQQVGLQGGQLLGQLGAQQQSMAQGDINQLMAAGGLQRQLAQQALDAQRQTALQREYEPYQRAEFLKNIYAAGPTSRSSLTETTTPGGGNPLAQAAGAGLGAYATYSLLNKNQAPAKV